MDKNVRKEIIIISIIVFIAVLINLPGLLSGINANKNKTIYQESLWEMSIPEDEGMDSELLSKADNYVKDTAACSLIVVRHGKIVLENYYNGYNANTRTNVFSVTKSYISALIGIAIEKKYIISLDQKISEYFPSYFENIEDLRKKDITIKHLLTMTPGFCEVGNEWYTNPNWLEYTLNLPLKNNPGERFEYSNSASHLLSIILTKATGKSTLEFANENLFEPLGITGMNWQIDPQNYNIGASNLFITPRDMAKFGLLYLNNGKMDNKQLVPAQWIKESTKIQYAFTKENDKAQSGYGFKWWISEASGCSIYSAQGYGGQRIGIIPELDLVIVITSVPDRQESFNDTYYSELLKKYIIPSVKVTK